MKLQTCIFKVDKSSDWETGVACVVSFDVEDIHWIIGEYGRRYHSVWSYKLVPSSKWNGCLETPVKATYFAELLGVSEVPDSDWVNMRIYHRRADLFGMVTEVNEGKAKVRYEFPHDGKSLIEVPVKELVNAYDVG